MPRKSNIPPAQRREWLERWERGERKDDIAKKDRRNPRTVADHIERARLERDLEQARQEQLRDALQAHQQDMLGLIAHLIAAIQVPALEFWPGRADFGLESLLEPSEWMQERQIGMGPSVQPRGLEGRYPILQALGEHGEASSVTVIRDEGGPQSVKLTVEDSLLWSALRQHLGNKDSLWRDLGDWRQALLAELQARAALNRTILGKIDKDFTVGVLLRAAPQEPHLTQAAPYFIRIELTRRALGKPTSDVAKRVWFEYGGLRDSEGIHDILAGNVTEATKEQLLILIDALTSSDEARQAAQAHRNLEVRAKKARTVLDEYRLLHHIRGWCSLCKKLGGQ